MGFSVALEPSRNLGAWAFTDQKRIVVTTGAAARLTEDELAWVVAHEIAHIEHEDGRRRQQLSDQLVETASATMDCVDSSLEDRGWGSFVRVVLTSLSTLAVGLAGTISNQSAVREHEREADQRATLLIRAAGYDPHAGERVLEKLGRRELHDEHPLHQLLASHPSASDRAKEVRRRIDSQES